MQMYHVVYEDTKTGDIRNYCMCSMSLNEALDQQRKFNNMYPGKPYPNGKGYYPFSEAWIEPVN